MLGKNPAILFLSSLSLPPSRRPSPLKWSFWVFGTFMIWRSPLLSNPIQSLGSRLPSKAKVESWALALSPLHSHRNWELEASVSVIPPGWLSFVLTAGLAIWEISSSAGLPQARPHHPSVPWWLKESLRQWGEVEWSSWSPAPLGYKWPWVGTQERHVTSDLYTRLGMMDIWSSGLGINDKNVKKKRISCLMHKQIGRVPEEWIYLLVKAS